MNKALNAIIGSVMGLIFGLAALGLVYFHLQLLKVSIEKALALIDWVIECLSIF